MKSQAYWRERFEALERENHADAMKAAKQIERDFDLASRAAQEKVSHWYARLAKNNGDISVDAARELLTKNELAEFHWDVEDYAKYAKENALNQKWIKELENASAKSHITRLEALETNVAAISQKLYAKYGGAASDLMKSAYKNGFAGTAFEIQKGLGVGFNVSMPNERAIERFLNKPWAPDGKTFSSRVWRDQDALLKSAHEKIMLGLQTGQPAWKFSEALAAEFDVSKARAERLLNTESAYFHNLATLDGYAKSGVEWVEILGTLDDGACAECGGLDGKKVKRKDAAPGVTTPIFHPNCRCTTVPYFDDAEDEERIARDADGNNIYVRGDMTYDAWAKEYLDGGGKSAYNKDEQTLTPQEQEAVKRYVSPDSYALNEKLRDETPLTAQEKAWAAALDAALEKLPAYAGTAYRSVSGFGIADVGEFVKAHEVDAIIDFSAYTSSGTAVYDESFPIQYVIESLNGRDIRAFNPEEAEILFKRGTQFVVTRVDGNTIYMREVSRDGRT